MTKFNFFIAALLAVAVPMSSMAQPKMLSFPATNQNNFYLDYVGARVTITSPASIAGPLYYTIANDGGGGQFEWGGSIQSNPINVTPIVKADPYEACGTLNNTAALTGKIALIKRGNCEFGAKALAAQQAGAVAVIIVNNVSGPPVGMGAGAKGANVTIPTIMLSDVDGAKIESALNNGAVNMTMKIWSNGYNKDLGFVNTGLSLFHANSIPLDQLKNSSSDILKGFDGCVIANFGNTTANTVKVIATVSWTPGTPGNITGTPTVVHKDSITINTPFAPSDSIITPIFDNAYSLNPSGTGRYDVEYKLVPDFADDFEGDNTASYSFFVDNRVYSKSRYDFAKNQPSSAIRNALGDANGNPITTMTGPMYYVEKGGYAIEKVAFNTYNQDTTRDMNGLGEYDVAVYKWKDADNDQLISVDECQMVGFKSYTLGSGDTSGQTHIVDINDPDTSYKATITESNTWYWATVSMPAGLLLGFDGYLNYYPRSWGRMKSTTPVRELYSPVFNGDYSQYNGSTGIVANPYPFDIASSAALEDSVRFAQQKRGFVASVSMQMSLFTNNVNEVEKMKGFDISTYPNPATSVLNISLKLDKQADKVRYSVFTMFGGKAQKDVVHENVKNDTYSISTANLAPGTYYVSVTVDGVSRVRKFTVIK